MTVMSEPPDEIDDEQADDLARYVTERDRRSPGFAEKVRRAEQQLIMEELLRRRHGGAEDEDGEDGGT